jgi:hypothetical protein
MQGEQFDAGKFGIGTTGAEVIAYFDLRIPLEAELSRGIGKTAKLATDLEWNDWRPE